MMGRLTAGLILFAALCVAHAGAAVHPLTLSPTLLELGALEDPPAAEGEAKDAAATAADTDKAAKDAENSLKELAAVINDTDGKAPAPLPKSGFQNPFDTNGFSYKVNVPEEISKSDANLKELDHQIELDVATAQEWYNLIQNYQFKYSTLLQRIQRNKRKAEQMRQMDNNLKGAATHEEVTTALSQVQAQVAHLLATAENDAAAQKTYNKVVSSISDLKVALDSMGNRVQETISTLPTKLDLVSRGPLPPSSADLLGSLVDDAAAAAAKDSKAPTKTLSKLKKKVTKKKKK